MESHCCRQYGNWVSMDSTVFLMYLRVAILMLNDVLSTVRVFCCRWDLGLLLLLFWAWFPSLQVLLLLLLLLFDLGGFALKNFRRLYVDGKRSSRSKTILHIGSIGLCGRDGGGAQWCESCYIARLLQSLDWFKNL